MGTTAEAPLSITITYPRGGAHDGYAEVHATGCAHTLRNGYHEPHITTERTFGADDFYYVAPCAKKLVSPPAT